MADISCLMAEMNAKNILRIMMWISVAELLPKEFHFILMPILFITLFDPLDHAKLLVPTMKMMDISYLCLNHQGSTMDISAVLLERADKQQRPNFRRQTSQN